MDSYYITSPLKVVDLMRSPTKTDLFSAAKCGYYFLLQHARTFQSSSEMGSYKWKDTYADALLLELTGNWNLVLLQLPPAGKKWNYFGTGGHDAVPLTTVPFPDDIDTQCVLATIITPAIEDAEALMDEILRDGVVKDGIIGAYFGPSRPRLCPGVAANVCTLFYTHGRQESIQPSFNFLLRWMKVRDWADLRYYTEPEPIFWYVLRLCKLQEPSAPELATLAFELKDAVLQRVGNQAMGNAACLSIRLLICQYFAVPNAADLEALLQLQDPDGGFDGGWFYTFGQTKMQIQHVGLTTAMAVQAMRNTLGEDFDPFGTQSIMSG